MPAVLAATRVDAILALLLSPFVALLIVTAFIAIAYVIHVDHHVDYMRPWRHRRPGDLTGGSDR